MKTFYKTKFSEILYKNIKDFDSIFNSWNKNMRVMLDECIRLRKIYEKFQKNFQKNFRIFVFKIFPEKIMLRKIQTLPVLWSGLEDYFYYES